MDTGLSRNYSIFETLPSMAIIPSQYLLAGWKRMLYKALKMAGDYAIDRTGKIQAYKDWLLFPTA